VCCSNDDVAYDFSESKNGKPQLSFKCPVPGFPRAIRFFLCLYNDRYACELRSIYQVFVHVHQRADLTSTVGQRTYQKLKLPAFEQSRRVQCFASAPDELRFENERAFQVQPGAISEIEFFYRTAYGGRRNCLVHLTDADTHELLHSWLFYINAVFPHFEKTINIAVKVDSPFLFLCVVCVCVVCCVLCVGVGVFQFLTYGLINTAICVQIPQVGTETRKKFQYENRYKVRRTYIVQSSIPDKLKVVEEVLEMPAEGALFVNIVIAPQSMPGAETIFLFINDERGKMEECYRFCITYVSA
jgi:hypothetical protein